MGYIPGPEWLTAPTLWTYTAVGGIGLIVTFVLMHANREFFDQHPVLDKLLLFAAVGVAVSMGIVL